MNERSLRRDWQTFGLVFENLCVRDLLVYARALPDASEDPVHYYRDDSGLEADAIVEQADGRWAAIEVKLGEDKVDEAAAHLLILFGTSFKLSLPNIEQQRHATSWSIIRNSCRRLSRLMKSRVSYTPATLMQIPT